MKKGTLQVALHATEPSIIELTVGERVQIDRITPSQQGNLAERHGALLASGVNRLSLARGHYFFKTLSNVHLHVVCGGVDATPIALDKGGPLDPPKLVPDSKGDDAVAQPPDLTIEP